MGVIAVMSPGGQGRDVLDALVVAGREVVGVLDDSGPGDVIGGVRVLGEPGSWREHAREGVAFVTALSSPVRRRTLCEEMLAAGASLESAIHPAATVSPRAVVGRSAVILAGCVLAPDARVGDYSILNAGCLVDHDCVLGTAVQFGPGVTLPGGVAVGDGAFVGAGATVLPGITIGASAVIGAGSVVTKDVAVGATVTGNPAKVRG